MSKSKYSWQNYRPLDQVKKIPHTPKQLSLPSFQQNFKIFLRVKPITSTHNTPQSIKILNSKQVEVTSPYYSTESDKIYHYQQVFGQQATNLQVFKKTMQDPINNVLSGYNSTVFIYGMTGAGKTHTMFNSINECEISQNEGIIGLGIAKLFENIKTDKNSKYQIAISFYEIYNQNIRDLLADHSHQLSIMEDPVKGIFINDLKEISVDNSVDARIVIQEGMAKRAINATKNNEASSRSHAILQFTIRKYVHQQKKSNEVIMMESKLFMIDLAGNQKAGLNQSRRFVEGININKSLLTLGKCINILSQNKKPTFIPFRDSKLTRILKDSLGGNSKTVMIACISPETRFYEQTLNTLKYSTKARKIKNKGKGVNIKLINRKEIPHNVVNDIQASTELQQEQRVFTLINTLEQVLKQKISVENMRQQLVICYHQNQEDIKHQINVQACKQNMKEINDIIPKINQRYNQLEDTLELQIKKLFVQVGKSKEIIYKQQISAYKLKLKEQSYQIERLKALIDDQRHQTINRSQEIKLNSSTQLENNLPSAFSQILSEDKQSSQKCVTPSCLSQKINSNNLILIHEESSGKMERGKHIIDINLTCKNSKNKENIFVNDFKKSTTPQQSLKSSCNNFSRVNTEINRANKRMAKRVIDITMQNIKIKSPQIKMNVQQNLNDRVHIKQLVIDNSSLSRDEFVNQLRQMDKSINNFSRERIGQFLELYESQSYQLAKTEKSMLNKVKFMFKTRQDKCFSVSGRQIKQNRAKKDRSLIK